MGFPIEFNTMIVLKGDLPELFNVAAAENLGDGPKQELCLTKAGTRIYPMGYEIPVTTSKNPNDLIGYAKVIQQRIDDLGDGTYRTYLRLGDIRGVVKI